MRLKEVFPRAIRKYKPRVEDLIEKEIIIDEITPRVIRCNS
jgi:hypothetical protein